MQTPKVRYTFENFVVGSSNQFAHAAALAVANQPGTTYNPLFIYGGVGLGKTHLLHAVQTQINRNWPNFVLVYLNAEAFINELINAIRYEKIPEFQARYRSTDVLLVDDVQFMAGKERTQEEFFHIFNAFYETQKQIVLTSDKIPKDIPDLEERLRSRFEWGLIADIQPPDMETRVAILRKKAELEGVVLPGDVALFIASHVHSNVRILEGSLVRLKAYSEMSRQGISIEMSKQVLKDILEDQQPLLSPDEIIKAVCKHYKVKPNDMKSPKRAKNIAMARQVAMYLCREMTSESFPEIGNHFGGKDHSTVIHAVNKIESLLANDTNLQRDLQTIRRTLL